MANMIEAVQELTQSLKKAYEAGNYDAAPGTLTGGAAYQAEDCSNVMELITFDDKSLKLTNDIKSKKCRSTTWQFNRKLSYGIFGGSAQLEGMIGQDETSDVYRITVPMCFYSHTRRVSYASTLVDTQDGKESTEVAAEDAAKKLAADIEFDLFRGREAFSNAGVFDANPASLPSIMANMFGLECQIRQSDAQRNAHDLMFGEFGSDDSIVVYIGGVLQQDHVEDVTVRSQMNHGNAEKLYLDPKSLSAYNKIVFGKERIYAGGSAPDATGGELRKQHTSAGTAMMDYSRFLSGKSRPQQARSRGPVAPQAFDAGSASAAGTTTFAAGDIYTYIATSGNEIGESAACASKAITITTAGDYVDLIITHPASGVTRWFNVYRSVANGTVATAKFVGRVVLTAGASVTHFTDLNNRIPGFVTGYLLQKDTYEVRTLAEYSRLKLAQSDLSTPEAHFTFKTLAVMQPRKNVLLDNIRG